MQICNTYLSYHSSVSEQDSFTPDSITYLRWRIRSFFVTFSAILQLSCDWPIITGGVNRSTQRNPLPKPIQWQLSHLPRPVSKPGTGERQLAVSGNALGQSAIRVDPRGWRTIELAHVMNLACVNFACTCDSLSLCNIILHCTSTIDDQ